MDTRQPKETTRPIEFVGAEEQAIIYANVVLIQRVLDGYVMTVGQGAPLIYGSPEEQEEQVKALDRVTVRPIIRLALPHPIIENLSKQLSEILALPESVAGDE